MRDNFYMNAFMNYKLNPQKKIHGVSVKHKQTCPECKDTLINLYLVNGEWKCKKCLDTIR